MVGIRKVIDYVLKALLGVYGTIYIATTSLECAVESTFLKVSVISFTLIDLSYKMNKCKLTEDVRIVFEWLC